MANEDQSCIVVFTVKAGALSISKKFRNIEIITEITVNAYTVFELWGLNPGSLLNPAK